MKDTVFYSWQSDLPNKENRNFIKNCIEKAIKEANREDKCLESDRDTNGISGSPNIQLTILQKISNSNVFVADVSIVNKIILSRKRKTPNPNVMFELGYAVKVLGWERVMCVFNEDYGRIEDLPFDIKQHRIISYSLKKGKDDAKKQVVGAMKCSIDMLAEKGLIYSSKVLSSEYLLQVAARDILFTTFKDGAMMSCYIDEQRKVDFCVKESTQQEWRIIGSYKEIGYNFAYDFSCDIDFDRYKVQISCFDLDGDGEKEVIVSMGDGSIFLETLVYRFNLNSANIFELTGRIIGQDKMIVDVNKGTILAPYGSQGLFEKYKYFDKKIWKLEPHVINRIC